MTRASVYVFASLVSGVSAALILASGSSYTEARFPQGTAHHFKGGRSMCHGGGDGCRTSPYQIANLNSAEDFCLWAPSQLPLSVTKDEEHALVAWCLKGAHSTRLIPEGAILGARLLITPEYLQITGVGNLSRINVPSGGTASTSGDRSHSLVFTSAYGQLEQIYDWTSFVSQDRFCFRACRPSAVASTTCPPIHDIFGCSDDAPGSYKVGMFEDCVGDATQAPSTLFQGVLAASSHDIAHPFSSCTTRRVVGDARVTRVRRAIPCTSNCTDASSTSSSTAYTNSSTPASSTPPVSAAYPSNDTCIPYPPWHPHHSSPSPPSSNISLNSSRCWSTASSNPSFTPAVSVYSSSDSFSFGTSPSTTSASAPTFTSTSTYDSPDPLPDATSSTPSPTFTSPSYLSSSSYDQSSPPPDPSSSFSSSSSSDYIASPSLTSLPLTLSSSTSPTLFPTSPSTPPESSPLSPSPSSTSSQSSSSFFPSDPTTTSGSSQSPTVSTPSSPLSPSSPSSAPSLVSPTFPNSQTQLGSQCPPPSQAVGNGVGRPVAPFLLSLILVILTIVSLSSIGVLVL